MDYHIIGFRECASEVARYLINTEGMDIQDPLRMRLISHLQCFVAQRELSAKSGSPANWTHPPYQPNYATPYHQNYPSHLSSSNGYIPNLPPPTATITPVPPSNIHHLNTSHTVTATSATETSQSAAILSDHAQEQHEHDSHHHHQSQHYNPHDSEHQAPPSYTDLSNEIHRNSSASLGYGNPQYPSGGAQYGNPNNGYNSNSSKPYRPWGAEMAY